MSEAEEKKIQRPTFIVDDVTYELDDMSDNCKIHYVQVIKLRERVNDLRRASVELQEDLVDASVSLEWREHQLRESVKLVEDEAEE